MPAQSYVTPLFVNSYSAQSAASDDVWINTLTGVAVGAWASANLRLYIPFALPWPYPVRRVFWVNGSSAGGNWSFAIHSIGGTLIYTTGSVAGSGASVAQYVTPTEFRLDPGRYYMSLVHDVTTASHTVLGSVTAIECRLMGCLQQASAFTAPTTMTGAQWAQTGYPLCGITKTTSGY